MTTFVFRALLIWGGEAGNDVNLMNYAVLAIRAADLRLWIDSLADADPREL